MFSRKCKTLCSPYSILFKENDIEFVDSCKLLGVKLSRDITDTSIFSCAWLLQKGNKVLPHFASLTSDVKSKYIHILLTHCNTLPIINKTDSIELPLEKRCVKFIWSYLNSSNVVVKNVSLFLLSDKDSIIDNNFRYFSYNYKVYRNNWFNKLIKCIYVVSSDSTLRYFHSIGD